jgi:NitT/TauT family transport system ATP-binding protein
MGRSLLGFSRRSEDYWKGLISNSFMAKIVIRNLTKTYSSGGVVALEDINLEVQPNESLCILGPSGCGKTTLLRIIDCLIARDQGEILIDGQLVTQPRPDIAMVFQHFGLFPWKRLEENIAYGLELRGRSRQEISATVERYVALIGLDGFEKSYPHQLSGGMQQRAGLARAMAINPSVLLMDEPFGALDAQTREFMQEELLRILENEKKTMLFVTHSIDEAILLGDRIVVMARRPGRIKEILPVDIPRPRKILSVRAHPRYIELRNSIWEMLKQDLSQETPGENVHEPAR